ncbi:McrC family protein [Brevundimonas sp. TWP2-3-4b1]|uniref:McrC family protein n=1 Tax=Brevundimonas sp. TWP2-3-4b1 TaxID=2804580 RepID=UPI003CE6AF92
MTTGHRFREWEPTRLLPARELSLDEQTLAQHLRKSGRLDVTETRAGLEVGTTSWVGRIVIGGVTITVHPKIEAAPLVQLLRYAFGLERLSFIGHASFRSEALAFQDILASQLAHDAARLIATGLHQDYLPREADLSSPRGRIVFDDLGRALSGGRAVLPCRYFERTDENLLNIALAAGLRLAARLVVSHKLAAELGRLAAVMDVGRQPLTANLLDAARGQLDRRTRRYAPLFDVVELLLEGSGISMEDGGGRMRLPGFLFDMNRFFQTLVSRLLNEHLNGCEVLDERRLSPMFHYATSLPRRSPPVLRPDFTIRSPGNEAGAVVDAKYRDLWERNLPSSMLYQLALYAHGSGDRRSVIVYPSLEPRADQEVVMTGPANRSELARIYLRALDLALLRRLLEAPPGAKRERALASLASRLAFGYPAEAAGETLPKSWRRSPALQAAI